MATRTEFPARDYEQLERESRALRDIATIIGASNSWDDTMLEAIASIVHHNAQLPDPGSCDNTAFYAEHAWW